MASLATGREGRRKLHLKAHRLKVAVIEHGLAMLADSFGEDHGQKLAHCDHVRAQGGAWAAPRSKRNGFAASASLHGFRMYGLRGECKGIPSWQAPKMLPDESLLRSPKESSRSRKATTGPPGTCGNTARSLNELDALRYMGM